MQAHHGTCVEVDNLWELVFSLYHVGIETYLGKNVLNLYFQVERRNFDKTTFFNYFQVWYSLDKVITKYLDTRYTWRITESMDFFSVLLVN